jgi:hypothetical protein
MCLEGESVEEWQQAWLAALILGEGHISLVRRKERENREAHGRRTFYRLRPMIRVTNTEKVLLDKCQELVGFGNVLVSNHNETRKNPHFQTAYIWDVECVGRCGWVLEHILPYLVGRKKEVATLLMEFCESRVDTLNKPIRYTARDWAIWAEIRKLNRKGGKGKTKLGLFEPLLGAD